MDRPTPWVLYAGHLVLSYGELYGRRGAHPLLSLCWRCIGDLLLSLRLPDIPSGRIFAAPQNALHLASACHTLSGIHYAEAIPKALAHGMALSNNTVQLLVESIVLGQASWFVAALIVAELVFSLILHVSRENIWAVVLTAVLGLPTSLFVSHHVGECCVWQLNQALLALSYLALGYGIHRMKNNLSIQREWNRTNQGRDFLFPFRFYSLPNGVRKQLCSSIKATMLTAALAALMIIKGLERKSGGNFILCPLQISHEVLFAADSLLAVFLTTEVCQSLEQRCLHTSKAMNSLEATTRRLLWLLEHTGRQSLVYYFFCGGIPLLVSRVLPHIGLTYHDNYGIILLAFALVYLVTGILADLFYRLCPQLVGNKSREATT